MARKRETIDHAAEAEAARARLRQPSKKVGNRNSAITVEVEDDLGDTCGARLKTTDGFCSKPAGWGTDHVGAGPCRLHGGMTPVGIKSAARTQLAQLAGRELMDVRPMDALLMCVRIAAMEVRVFSEKIDELDPDELLERPSEQIVAGANPEKFWIKKQQELNIWLRAREKAMDRLVRYSKAALDAGVEERQIQLAERMGDILANTVQRIVDDLELTPEQQILFAQTAPRHLRLAAGGA